jgi:hypothetical protein
MDFVARNEAEKKAIKDFWKSLVKKLEEAVENWNKHYPLKWECDMDSQDVVFSVSRRRPDGNVVVLSCEFDQDSRGVEAKEGLLGKDALVVVSLHRIVLNPDRKASLRRSDGTAVEVDDAVDEILWRFLEKHKRPQ